MNDKINRHLNEMQYSVQCFGSGFVFYGSGSWNFSPIRIRIQAKKLIFSKAITKFWEKFFISSQKVGILFLFSTNQVDVLLNREILFGIIFKNEVKIMKNWLKKWILIAEFHFQDPDSEYGSSPAI